MAIITRIAHILAVCGDFSLFTKHKNILNILSTAQFKVWALQLVEFHFTIDHIPEEKDRLGRYAY